MLPPNLIYKGTSENSWKWNWKDNIYCGANNFWNPCLFIIHVFPELLFPERQTYTQWAEQPKQGAQYRCSTWVAGTQLLKSITCLPPAIWNWSQDSYPGTRMRGKDIQMVVKHPTSPQLFVVICHALFSKFFCTKIN